MMSGGSDGYYVTEALWLQALLIMTMRWQPEEWQ